MRIILAAAALCAIVAGGAGASLAATTQQDKMKSCNATAATKQLTGDARKQFMSSCLSGSANASTTASAEAVPFAPDTTATDHGSSTSKAANTANSNASAANSNAPQLLVHFVSTRN